MDGNLTCVVYKDELGSLLHAYMKRSAPPNNRDPKRLRLADYDGVKGDLFLLIDKENQIRATAAVTLEPQGNEAYAKIYGRLHLERCVLPSAIDRFFEPAMFSWCLERGIDKLFMTVNEGSLRTWDWLCRRIGRRRAGNRPNVYAPQLGAHFRREFRPHHAMILERGVWQYVIYYEPGQRFTLRRPERPLPLAARRIARREFHDSTSDWDELYPDLEDSQNKASTSVCGTTETAF